MFIKSCLLTGIFLWVGSAYAVRPQDITPPQILEIKLTQNSIKAGNIGQILFKAIDENSGFNLDHPFIEGLFSNESNSQEVSIDLQIPKSLGQNWFSADFIVGQYLPSGEYKLSFFFVEDKEGNQADIDSQFVLVLNVENDGQEDIQPPEVTQVKLQNNTVSVGSNGVVLFKAKDSVSGLNLVGDYVYGRFENKSDPSQQVSIYTTVAPSPLGNDLYSIEFEVDEFIAPGEYDFVYFWIKDNAGNEIVLHTSDLNQILTVTNSSESDN
ncbi:MAG: hypothetical protein H6625_07375 [Bdellovibrionaceae bacterium]|nr:hypothetical protein [Pseudobdellovibrionaceae bacterium]